jgi:hypothetical protein
VSSSIPELELPIQAFVLGTALGMIAATVRYHLIGDLERWPLIVGYFSLAGLLWGLLTEVFFR